MSSDLRLQRLDEKLDRVVDTLAELRADMKVMQHTLDEHDARSSKAMTRANEAYELADSQAEWLRIFPKVRVIGLWVTAVGGAAYFIWDRILKYLVN